MLRIHFTPEDLARVRLARAPDPLWEIASSLHRLQTTRGRWAYADWYRTTRDTLAGTRLGDAVRRLLMPLLPRAQYFPDFLTPYEAADGLGPGLAAIVDTPPRRVAQEIGLLGRTVGAPGWAGGLVDRGRREELAKVLRAYHEAVLTPHRERMDARIAGEHVLRGRETLDGGLEGLFAALAPTVRWQPPVLHVDYVEDRDLLLAGRGLRLVPSYFCWQRPIALADDTLQPVLVYPVQHPLPSTSERLPEASLASLLGRTRAAALRMLALGATTSELACALGVSAATATHHTTVLRDAGLVLSRRVGNTVLHTLTPLGAALLRPRNATDLKNTTDLRNTTDLKSTTAPTCPDSPAGATASAASPGTFEPG
ncbi:helix-turn-helix domain-containing protein [Streptomyces griseorubiginosus]|uniref:ArsR/SmtB family transcription factor n=1 Tax=Streptomyces griseorubiginosus TaxID=67304 RepID=UPI0033B482D0